MLRATRTEHHIDVPARGRRGPCGGELIFLRVILGPARIEFMRAEAVRQPAET